MPIFFNDTATPEIYPLSLHDALPISRHPHCCCVSWSSSLARRPVSSRYRRSRSEEHTSELQSHVNLVCRLLLEKKNRTRTRRTDHYVSSRTGRNPSFPPGARSRLTHS